MKDQKNGKSPTSFSISELQDDFARKIAEEFLSNVPPQRESEPVTPRLNLEDCTVCPYAETMRSIDLGGIHVQGPVEKADVQCLILVDKFKAKKVADKWIVPSKKNFKCIKTTKTGEQYGWENPEIFNACEVLHPPKKTTFAKFKEEKIKSLYGIQMSEVVVDTSTYGGIGLTHKTMLLKSQNHYKEMIQDQKEKREEWLRTRAFIERREIRRISHKIGTN